MAGSTDYKLVEEGGSGKKAEPKKTCSTPVIIVLCVVGVLILVAAGVIAAIVAIRSMDNSDYGIIIDAGSSGSRIYVYKWPHRPDNSTIPVVAPVLPDAYTNIQQVRPTVGDATNNVSPGIAKIDPANISDYLQPLFDYADKLVPNSQKPRTPIFLFATAGMRLIPEDKQNAILTAVRAKINSTSYNFTYYKEWARVITGAEEGVYGWVTANYLKGILFEQDAKNHVVGALDLGGASLQITFLPKEKPKANEQTLLLPTNTFELYTYSFLSYGQDQSLKGVTQIAIDAANTSGTLPYEIQFPCFLNGYSEIITLDDGNHSLVGTGDFDTCSAYEQQYMNITAPCDVPPCSMDGVYQPNVTGDFYAMSGFYYTSNFFGFSNETMKNAPILFKENGIKYCQKSWDEAKKENPDLSTDLLKLYCFTSSYIFNVLTAGFGFDENASSIYFTKEINGTSLNWALGALIAEASLLPK